MKGQVFILFLFIGNIIWGQQPRLMLPIGHTSPVSNAQYSPDGKKVISSSVDGKVKIWDVATGSLLADLICGTTFIKHVEFSPDGKRILTVCNDNFVKVWNTETGLLYTILKGHSDLINYATFSPDSKKIVTSANDSSVRIWEAYSGRILTVLKGNKAPILVSKFNPDGKDIVALLQDGLIKIWNVSTGALKFTLVGNSKGQNQPEVGPGQEIRIDVEYCSNGMKLLSISNDGIVKIWDIVTGKLVYDLKGILSPIIFAKFSPDSKKIITTNSQVTASTTGDVSLNNSIKIWDSNSGNLITQFNEHSGSVVYAEFSPDSKKIVTASQDMTSMIWDADSGKLLLELKGHTDYVNSAHFSPDGRKLITSSGDHSSKLWDLSTGMLLSNLSGHTTWVNSELFSPDGNYILTSNSDNVFRLWDTKTSSLRTVIKGNSNYLLSAVFNPNGLSLVTSSLNKSSKKILLNQFTDSAKIWCEEESDSISKIFEVPSGNLRAELRGHNSCITSAEFSSNGEKILTASADGTIRIWNANNGKQLSIVNDFGTSVSLARYSPDCNSIITITDLQNMEIYDNITFERIKWGNTNIYNATNGELEYTLKSFGENAYDALFSPNGKIIVTAARDSILFWDAKTGNLLNSIKQRGNDIHNLEFSNDSKKIIITNGQVIDPVTCRSLFSLIKDHTRIRSAHFSPKGNKIITGYDDGTAQIWNAINGKLILTLKGHNAPVWNALFSPDEQKVLTVSNDQTSKIWNAISGKLIYTFLSIDTSDFINLIPSGYYQSTTNASKLLHYVTKDLKVINFDQLDVKYNRPDKVLEAVGCTDTALIESYRRAYYKRIKKLGIDTSAFREGYNVPELDFVNRDEIQNEQKMENLVLKIKGTDGSFALDRFNIWVNEVPIYGLNGISIRNRNSNFIDTIISVKLSLGENRIEASTLNINGTESYRMPLNVTYKPEKQEEGLHYFIGIGIDKFSDSRYNLKYSSKDIRDLCLKFKAKYGENIIIDTLFNENVTLQNVKSLKQKLQKTGVNDQVIISYSGHGLLSRDYDYYLSTYSINFEQPEEHGLPYDELEHLLDSIPARQKLLLIDACHSGEVDKDEIMTLNKIANSNGLKGAQLIEYPHQEQMGLKNSFELMQSLFANVGKNTGTIIISAAAGNQFALERDNLKNGVFTYTILETLDKYPTIKIHELKKIIGTRVEQLTNGLQKPTFRNETIAVDWVVW